MPGRYARETSVSVDRSCAELERTVQRYGASGFLRGWEGNRAVVGFKHGDLQVRMLLELPDPQAQEYQQDKRGRTRNADVALRAWEQDCRTSWRALLLVVKAKLEAVEAGISTVEREFMPDLVLPGGRRVEEMWDGPALREGKLPPLLPGKRG